jgi:hypothetical protein
VSADRNWLRTLQEPITRFLSDHLHLDVNSSKTVICDVRIGVEFLGAYLKPRRRYISTRSLRRIEQKIPQLRRVRSAEQLRNRLNSFLGILSHYRSYRIRHRLFYSLLNVYAYGYFTRGMTKFVVYPKQMNIQS